MPGKRIPASFRKGPFYGGFLTLAWRFNLTQCARQESNLQLNLRKSRISRPEAAQKAAQFQTHRRIPRQIIRSTPKAERHIRKIGSTQGFNL